MNLWEAVHRTFDLRACDLLHVIEVVGEELSALLESIKDIIALSAVLLEALGRLTSHGRWVHHEVHSNLTNRVRAQLDRLELVEDLLGTVR